MAACTHMAESITKVIRVYTQTHTKSRGMWCKAPAAVTLWDNNDLQNGEDWMVGLLLFAHKPNWYLKDYLCVTIGTPPKVTHVCNAYRWNSPTLNSSAQKGTVDTHTHTHAHIHTDMHTHVHTHTHMHTHTHAHAHRHVRTFPSIHTPPQYHSSRERTLPHHTQCCA